MPPNSIVKAPSGNFPNFIIPQLSIYPIYEKRPIRRQVFYVPEEYYFCLQTWLPTVQDVLHADWQEVWHSPQPPVLAVACKDSVLIVRIRLAMIIPPQ